MQPTIKEVSYSVVVIAVPRDGQIHKYQHFYNYYDSARDFISTSQYDRSTGDYIYYEIGLYKLTEFDTNPITSRTDVKYLKQYHNGSIFKAVIDNEVIIYDTRFMDFSETQIKE